MSSRCTVYTQEHLSVSIHLKDPFLNSEKCEMLPLRGMFKHNEHTVGAELKIQRTWQEMDVKKTQGHTFSELSTSFMSGQEGLCAGHRITPVSLAGCLHCLRRAAAIPATCPAARAASLGRWALGGPLGWGAPRGPLSEGRGCGSGEAWRGSLGAEGWVVEGCWPLCGAQGREGEACRPACLLAWPSVGLWRPCLCRV